MKGLGSARIKNSPVSESHQNFSKSSHFCALSETRTHLAIILFIWLP
jgi:hypothetical protein